jgi:hypothetical protein
VRQDGINFTIASEERKTEGDISAAMGTMRKIVLYSNALRQLGFSVTLSQDGCETTAEFGEKHQPNYP